MPQTEQDRQDRQDCPEQGQDGRHDRTQQQDRGKRHSRRDPRRRSPRAAARPGRIASAIGVLGELLITGGVILALFVAYSLWWTNVQADREARRESDRVRDRWAATDAAPAGTDSQDRNSDRSGPDIRDGIGFLHAPTMTDREILVSKGTDPENLNKGVAGYYERPVRSAMPWDKSGNFSLAAHRDGHGARFHNIHKIQNGDPLVFETRNTWYIYRAYARLEQTSKYNVKVLEAVPMDSGKNKPGRYITLTTCTPVFTSTHRYIIWGELERTEKVDAERTLPAELR